MYVFTSFILFFTFFALQSPHKEENKKENYNIYINSLNKKDKNNNKKYQEGIPHHI